MSVPDESDRPAPPTELAELTLRQIGHKIRACIGSVLAGLTPRSIDARIKTLAGTEEPTWGGDTRLLLCWFLVWLSVLLSAVVSPIIVLFQYIFQERRWRLVLVFFVGTPLVLAVVLFAVLAIGMAGFQFGK
tara:strand:+ start:79367 stop:79762 length:396 start_codon:yes stop_codon:yes gene_type:complete